jgi:ferric-dicitrate binding protein FerR (iron transport regulator)
VAFEPLLDKIHHSINILEARVQREKHSFSNRFFFFAKVAAAVFIIFLASAGVWYSGYKGLFQKEAFYTVTSVRGQSSCVNLADGSRLWLNGESSIVYSSRYGLDNRTLKLEGEGFFEVAKNKKLPFVVETDGVEVTALGTCFNVDAYNRDGSVLVTLETGKVRISEEGKTVALNAGSQALVKDGKIRVKDVDTELYTSWRNGKIVFKNEMLTTITSQLEKMYEVQFVYKTDTLRNFRYRGTISLDNSIFKALEMLRVSTGIGYEVKDNKVVLTSY